MSTPADGNSILETFLGVPALISGPSMLQLMDRVRRVAPTHAAVLITGETGSGKESVARAVHQYSQRSSRPWVDVNCAALPDHLLESELFGYEKGAFSGADTQKPGLFELANGGSLFLDEIGEMDAKLQVKLLRVLDGAPYFRLGGTRKVTTDARIIAATNIDLQEAVEKGRFRRDLYHRLDQSRLRIPALRERPESIEPLVRYFLQADFPRLTISESALRAMREYAWPGNVRELKNAVIKAALAADGDLIECLHLPIEIQNLPANSLNSQSLEAMEQQAILRALLETGRQDSAARLLGISKRTLIRKLRIYESRVQSDMVC